MRGPGGGRPAELIHPTGTNPKVPSRVPVSAAVALADASRCATTKAERRSGTAPRRRPALLRLRRGGKTGAHANVHHV